MLTLQMDIIIGTSGKGDKRVALGKHFNLSSYHGEDRVDAEAGRRSCAGCNHAQLAGSAAARVVEAARGVFE